jgi:hypothetical protein
MKIKSFSAGILAPAAVDVGGAIVNPCCVVVVLLEDVHADTIMSTRYTKIKDFLSIS